MKLHAGLCVLIILFTLVACSGANTNGGQTADDARFMITITGDLSATFEPTKSDAGMYQGTVKGMTAALRFSNNASSANGRIVQTLTFAFNGIEPATGTYDVESVEAFYTDSQTDSKGVVLTVLDNTSGERQFSGTGKLTLDVKDGKYSGSFTLSLTGGVAGKNDQSIAVEGTFSQIGNR